jgi:hypothetical protein
MIDVTLTKQNALPDLWGMLSELEAQPDQASLCFGKL